MSDITTASRQSNIRQALDASKYLSDLSYTIGDYLHFVHNIRMRAILENQETPSREELEELRKCAKLMEVENRRLALMGEMIEGIMDLNKECITTWDPARESGWGI